MQETVFCPDLRERCPSVCARVRIQAIESEQCVNLGLYPGVIRRYVIWPLNADFIEGKQFRENLRYRANSRNFVEGVGY